MNGSLASVLVTLCLAGLATAEGVEFEREGDAEERVQKNALEGKAPPPLSVSGWLNVDGEPLSLAGLRGQVVVLDFWGVW